MQLVVSDGGRSNYFKGEADDCVCRAICNATGKDYKEVYDDLNRYIKSKIANSKRRKHKYSENSSSRNGVPKSITRDYIIEVLGWKWHPIMNIGEGCTMHLTESEIPNGILIIKVSRHITCTKDKILYDTYDCSRNGTRCVYGYFTKN